MLRPYDAYTEQEWQRQESWLWSRRREPLHADKAGRAPEQMPRGRSDGPLHHWRRGLVGAVQDWAEGSKADAATLVLSLIKELELEVSCCACCRHKSEFLHPHLRSSVYRGVGWLTITITRALLLLAMRLRAVLTKPDSVGLYHMQPHGLAAAATVLLACLHS